MASAFLSASPLMHITGNRPQPKGGTMIVNFAPKITIYVNGRAAILLDLLSPHLLGMAVAGQHHHRQIVQTSCSSR